MPLDVPPNLLNYSVRVLAAALMGGVVGWERRTQRKPAGPRTHAIIAATSAAVMHAASSVFPADAGKMMAALVSATGFIGAGVIIRSELRVVGVTTAATLWGVTALGIMSGMGLVAHAAVLFAVVLVLLEL